MKDPLSYSDYRTKYKKYYGINFNSKKYVIHHLDLNHKNNDIENLLLLPSELHGRYHYYLSLFAKLPSFPTTAVIDVKICGNAVNSNNYELWMFEKFCDVLSECSLWYDYRSYLQGLIPNIHGIELEE